MASWSWTTRACRAAIAVLALAAAGCRSKPLPTYAQVPDFTLTSQTGALFRASSLDGSVWVADFFFTNCPGPCPRMSASFGKLDKTFSTRNDFKLVSMTVDPARDSAPVLAEYGRRFHAEPGRWFLLTGPMDQLNRLCRDVFLLGNVDGSLDHSTRFILVDRKRQIRGFYHSNDPVSIQQLMRDIGTLLKEKT